MDIDTKLREILTKTIKKCPHSRQHIAKEMSEITGTVITKEMIDSWTAKAKNKHRFPAIFLPAFCIATNNSKALSFLTRKANAVVLSKEDALRVDIHKLQEERDKINKRIKKKKSRLNDLETE